MDVDGCGDSATTCCVDQRQGGTELAKQLRVPHVCSHTCAVSLQFGNVWKCHTSGQLHICDATCQQRVYRDRYTTICRVSRHVACVSAPPPVPSRKRTCSIEGDKDASAKRQQVHHHVEAMIAM